MYAWTNSIKNVFIYLFNPNKTLLLLARNCSKSFTYSNFLIYLQKPHKVGIIIMPLLHTRNLRRQEVRYVSTLLVCMPLEEIYFLFWWADKLGTCRLHLKLGSCPSQILHMPSSLLSQSVALQGPNLKPGMFWGHFIHDGPFCSMPPTWKFCLARLPEGPLSLLVCHLLPLFSESANRPCKTTPKWWIPSLSISFPFYILGPWISSVLEALKG